jgi:diguanylate cyclase (GGDEF)-like protein
MLAEAHAELAALCEAQGDVVAALDHFKRFHAIREAQFETTRTHAARAFNLWRDFQRATRQATELRERAATLAQDKQILERRADELAEVSEQDPLTGLLNRRALDTRIGAVVTASESEGLPMTVALLDVDHFKEINDRFSHGVGDAVLKRVADVVRDHCRVGDLPVRYGGDEFLVVLLGVGESDAEAVLLRLKRAVDACQWQRQTDGLAVTLSVGAATRAAGRSIADTIAAADRALYAAKAAGRNRIVCIGRSTATP